MTTIIKPGSPRGSQPNREKGETAIQVGEYPGSLLDVALLESFDPVLEVSSFQVVEEVLEATLEEDASEIPSAPISFDLAASLARIPEKLFFRIGDAAELLDVKPYVLRFWETEFPMVRPTKSRSGQRVYRKKDVEMLLLIKHLLYVERFSIEGARKRIRDLRLKPADAARKATAASVESQKGAAPQVAPIPSSDTSGKKFSGDASAVRDLLESARRLAGADLTKFFRF